MKSQIRIVLFALIAPLAACSGDRDRSASTGNGLWFTIPTYAPAPAQVTDTVAQTPAKVDAPVGNVEEPVAIPTTYEGAMTLGKALAAKSDTSRAREMFEAAAKLDRKKAEPYIELTRLFVATGDRALAIKSATKAVKLAPDSSQAYNTLGRAELARFNYDNAIVAFHKAVELNPDNVWAWNNLGYTHLQLKHYQDAIDALVEATSKQGATGYMFNNLGSAYEHLDQLDDARLAFDKGGELGSSEAKASRKRLEGVDTIVVTRTAKVEAPKAAPKGGTFENAEPMPDPDDAVDENGVKVEVKLDSATVDEPKVDAAKPEPKADEPKVDAPKVEAPVTSSPI